MVAKFNNNEAFLKVLGHNDAAIEDCYECLGSLMADADRVLADADMGFQNFGGVRFDSMAVRPILLKDVLSLDPFDNELVVFQMTGQEIVDFLGVSFFTDRGPNYCSGCTYTYSVDEEGQMKDCQVTLDNGKPMDLKATYKVVMNSYMSSAFDFPHADPGLDIGAAEVGVERVRERHDAAAGRAAVDLYVAATGQRRGHVRRHAVPRRDHHRLR